MSALITAVRHPRAWWRLTRQLHRQWLEGTCARKCGKRGTDRVVITVHDTAWPEGTIIAVCQEHAEQAVSAHVAELL